MYTYKVISILKIQNNTAVMLEGDLKYLRNDMSVSNEKSKEFHILSVGMTDFRDVSNIGKITCVLIEGEFEGENLYVR